jgi:tetratricopeptide (TPR) repeat protein
MKIPQEFLTTVAKRVGVSENELEVLTRAVEGQAMTAISQQLGVRKDALQKRLGEVYKKFEIPGSGPGKLAKLEQFLISEYEKQMRNRGQQGVSPTGANRSDASCRWDLNEAPEVTSFCGRSTQLQTLERWIVAEKCPVVAVVGMGGVGKTALVRQAIADFGHCFDCIVWRTLNDRHDLATVLDSAIAFISDRKESDALESLRSSRCLLVLDALEHNWRSRREDCETIIDLFLKSSPQSCLLLTSWDLPLDHSKFGDRPSEIRVLELGGLSENEARTLLQSSSYPDLLQSDLISELINLYAGNPLILKLVANHAEILVSGNLAQFIKSTTFSVGQLVRKFLETHYNDEIPRLAIEIASWLSVNGDRAISLQDLQENGIVDPDELWESERALEWLEMRSIVIQEQSHNRMVCFRLSSQITQEITHQLLAKYLNKIGHKSYNDGNFKSAKTDLKNAIRYNEVLAPAQYNLGATYEHLDCRNEAIAHYQEAAKQQNRAAYAAINNLARLQILEGHLDDAIAQLKIALERASDRVIIAALHKNLGWGYWLHNHCGLAFDHLHQSIDLEGDRPAAYYLLAQVLEGKGELEEAIGYWEKGLQLDLNNHTKHPNTWSLPELKIWQMMARQRLGTRSPKLSN